VEITEVRIKLADVSRERLHAFCSITIDGCFVVRDLKIIHGAKGPFVAMPSRKLTDRCARCQCKNCLRALYCGQCGMRLPERRALRSQDGRTKLYADIAHPINSACRDAIQTRILDAFEHEKVLAQQPGYVCRYDDFGIDDDESFDDWSEPVPPQQPARIAASNRRRRSQVRTPRDAPAATGNCTASPKPQTTSATASEAGVARPSRSDGRGRCASAHSVADP
jgi:stage V sporulation protein G